VKISITDSGLGMDEKTKLRIFEPFFTTKEMGRGTGLGLASVYGIIKNHAGAINVYSEIGFGTTFNIYLPSSGKEPMGEKRPQESIKRGTEQILLIDDQDHVLKVGQKILERLGYTVLGAGNGEEALVLYKKNKGKIRLVILDMIMPGMNGSEVFEQLKKINPGVKVLLSSGYSLNGEAKRMIERGVRAFIQKPFTMASISQKVREILDDELNEGRA
jgi:CheY-like chemotaxis protein